MRKSELSVLSFEFLRFAVDVGQQWVLLDICVAFDGGIRFEADFYLGSEISLTQSWYRLPECIWVDLNFLLDERVFYLDYVVASVCVVEKLEEGYRQDIKMDLVVQTEMAFIFRII